MTLAKLLPLAFVMIAGPQILSTIFLATTENWRKNTLAFVAGAGLSVTIVVSIGYALSAGASNQGASNNTLDIIVLVLLFAAALHKFLGSPRLSGLVLISSFRDVSFQCGRAVLGVASGDGW